MGWHRNHLCLRHWNKSGASAGSVLLALAQRKQSELRKYLGGKLHLACFYVDEYRHRQRQHFSGDRRRRGIHDKRVFQRCNSCRGPEPLTYGEFFAGSRGRGCWKHQCGKQCDQFPRGNFPERQRRTAANLRHPVWRQLWQCHRWRNQHTDTHHSESWHGCAQPQSGFPLRGRIHHFRAGFAAFCCSRGFCFFHRWLCASRRE